MARHHLFAAALCLGALSAPGCWLMGQGGEPTPQSLSGHWASIGAEPTTTEFGPAFLFRTLKVKQGRYSLRYELSADRAGHSRWLAVELSGGLGVGAKQAKPEGAHALDFGLERLAMTPYTPAFVAALNRAPVGQCGSGPWRLGLTQDLVPSGGCPALGFTVQAGDASRDVVRLDGEKLFLGQRDPNAPLFQRGAARPTAWGLPLARLGEAD